MSYTPTIDHSQDIEIHETKDGRIFGIKNIRQEIKRVGDNDVVTFIADMAGDMKAGQEYLKDYAEMIRRLVLVNGLDFFTFHLLSSFCRW